jgi:hypothetical protein
MAVETGGRDLVAWAPRVRDAAVKAVALLGLAVVLQPAGGDEPASERLQPPVALGVELLGTGEIRVNPRERPSRMLGGVHVESAVEQDTEPQPASGPHVGDPHPPGLALGEGGQADPASWARSPARSRSSSGDHERP